MLHKIRWRVEARRLEVEEELFSQVWLACRCVRMAWHLCRWCQASIDAERPDQMDALGVFPPVINHARANVDFALRRVLPTSCMNVRVRSACSFQIHCSH